MAANVSFCREGRYDEPSSGRVYLHARTDDGEKVTERLYARSGDRKKLKNWYDALPILGEDWRVLGRGWFSDGDPRPGL